MREMSYAMKVKTLVIRVKTFATGAAASATTTNGAGEVVPKRFLEDEMSGGNLMGSISVPGM